MIFTNKKNMIKVQCSTCDTSCSIYKYAKNTLSCKACTSLIATPAANKVKLFCRYQKREEVEEEEEKDEKDEEKDTVGVQ